MLSLLGAGVLSFTSADHNAAGHQKPDCVVSNIIGTVCPGNIVDFVNYHATAVKNLSSGLLFFALFVLAILFIAFWSKIYHPPIPADLRQFSRWLKDREIKSASGGRKILSWLSLFELSPSV